ncbi:tRNA 2-selenouridine(34) synthase MnmH [Actibacterium ureilyticum]|uniref:tRNA 2-selenouridine(34) synthase MnmH n=1 Tax=Actibacterium ureilyticum TaxID=1590614 RepID=UPI000BAAC3A3|nr:tRNA 2-selenouridine(34) synthase MnmH [Actibacterium ureilyticum]
MPIALPDLAALTALEFDEIIDARSPAEYAEDHIPGALSLPVLSDDERARVGTIYKQQNPFAARKLGAALVARNVAHHLDTVLADRPKGYRPLVYCWRGGQRSGSFALILRQIGWQAETIDGGYRSYRRLVNQALYDTPWPSPVIVLDGNTGTAKTDLLALLAARGQQVIDLEGMANHRGSLFGAMAGGQPAQKAFETRLAMAATALDPTRPVLVEAESSRVGERSLPPSLWQAMCAAPRIMVDAPLPARAAYLARRYTDVTNDPARLAATLQALAPRHSADRIDHWRALAEQGAFADLAGALMGHHYDPLYAKQRGRYADRVKATVTCDGLAPDDLDRLADRIAEQVARLSGS